MRTLWLDTESFNGFGSVSDLGGYEFARTGEPLLLTYAWDDDPPVAVLPDEPPPDFTAADRIIAHNAGYDRQVLLHQWHTETPIEQWRCSATAARCAQLPGGLAFLGEFLGLVDEAAKLEGGKELIRMFCQLTGDTRVMPDDRPEEFARFIRYGLRDVVAMRECWKCIPKSNYLLDLQAWFTDQRMNDRGLPVDIDFVREAYKTSAYAASRLNGDIKVLTDGAVPKVSSRSKFLLWATTHDTFLLSTQRDYLESVEVESLEVRKGIELMLAGARAAPKKYLAFLSATDPTTSRFRGGFVFSGATRTMRWSGKTVQPQNFFRPPPGFDVEAVCDAVAQGHGDMVPAMYPDYPALSIMAYAVRGSITAPEGRRLVVGDLSQIEARVLLWLVGQDDILAAFEDPDRDPYVEMATAVGTDSRDLGKALVLACGFGMAGPKFRTTVKKNAGVILGGDEAKAYVYAWRDANPLVVEAWDLLTDGLIRWFAGSRDLEYRPHQMSEGQRLFDRITITKNEACTRMMVELPSGHVLHYYNVRVGQLRDDVSPALLKVMSDEMPPEVLRERMGNVVMGFSGITAKASHRRITWGGGLIENIVQSIARHVMVAGMPEGELVGTVHDELIYEAPEEDAEALLAHLLSSLSQTPSWAPGLPLAAEGKVLRRYQK